MQFKDQETIQVHFKDTVPSLDLAMVSNNDGVFAYFPSEKIAFNFAKNIALTSIRLDRLLETIEIDTSDETSYNELELIRDELKYLRELNK